MKAIFIILIVFLLATGCTQPAAHAVAPPLPVDATTGIPVPDKPVIATAQKIDSTKILITYMGGPDADQLIELETTVINNKGSVTTQSIGSRLDTTPVRRGGTDIIKGPFSEKVHVLITGYFFNGTHQDILETWI